MLRAGEGELLQPERRFEWLQSTSYGSDNGHEVDNVGRAQSDRLETSLKEEAMRCEKIPLQRKSMITMTMMTSMVSVSMHPLYIAFKLPTVVEALVLGSVTIAGLKNKLLGSIRLLSLWHLIFFSCNITLNIVLSCFQGESMWTQTAIVESTGVSFLFYFSRHCWLGPWAHRTPPTWTCRRESRSSPALKIR